METTHLRDHCNICQVWKAMESMNEKLQSPSLAKGEGKRKLEAYIFDQEFARKELANIIIMHEYSLSIVEHVRFKRYSYALQPLYKMVSRNIIKSNILKIYDFEKMKTLKMIEQNKSRVVVMIDMWTSSNQKREFMVITTHFIDDYWKLQSRIVRFAYVPCPQIAQVMCDELMETFLD
ncbi:hypothetical protein CsSME_00007759 [Camellia sinensis var. sinensis]